MFSFLQNQLGRSSTLLSPTKRSGSTQNHMSGSDSTPNPSSSNSEVLSLTPATSTTDAASFSTDATSKVEGAGRGSDRLRHARPSLGYNVKELSGTKKRRPRRKTTEASPTNNRTSDEIVVKDSDSAQEQLMHESDQALNQDWTLGALPGDSLELAASEAGVTRRRSTRLDILEKASDMVENASSVLGKRGRETVDAGMEKLKGMKGNKRSSLIARDPETPSFEGPMAKKTRFSEALDEAEKSTPAPKPERKVAKRPTKRWLSQGLYLGQDREFDARLSESKNKAKKESNKAAKEQRQPLLPLPMFAGQRLIENGRDFRMPFNVFNPLPPGQPKPEEWKKTHKNVFVGDAADLWKKTKSQESSKCNCTPESGCNEDCHNRCMLYECDSSNCNVGPEHCTNRAFESLRQRTKAGGKYRIGVEVCKTLDRGYGVRSNRAFETEQIIVEYTGEIITQEECDNRMHGRYKDAECYYLMSFDQQMILDATRGSIARFINHSCEPNCRMIKWTVGGKPRMALFAGDKGIMTGEELTYDYNFDPYSVKNVQQCRCGSANCRGVLGPRPREIKDALKPITSTAGGKKRKLKEAMEGAVEAMVGGTRKRKIAVPKSVKSVLAKAKEATAESWDMAKSAIGSSAATEQAVKKESQKSLRGWKGWVLVDDDGQPMSKEATAQVVEDVEASPRKRRRTVAAKDEQKKPVTSKKSLVAHEKRRSSNGTFLKKTEQDGEETVDEDWTRKSKDVERSTSRRDSMKTKEKSAVRTIRRSSKAGARTGKTIRVIGDDED